MALNTPSKPARGRPTIGRKIAFHVPLPASKRAKEKSFDKTDQTFCRIYCKDSIGYFLGLPLADFRKIEAKPAFALIDLPHQGPKVIRAVADRTSARPYTLILQPGTTVKQGKYKWYQGAGAAGDFIPDVEIKSLQFFLPAYMPIWRILDWLGGKRNTYQLDQGESEVLPGMTFDNYESIIAVVSPNQRTYSLESILYKNRIPPSNPSTLAPVGPDQANP